LRRIEESLGIAYKSDIGNPNRSGGPRDEGPSVVYGPTSQLQLPKPQGPMPAKAERDAPGKSSKPEDELQ
jgi:hypothetical protein